MSTEPETRPFTSHELAHFLEQFELDRPSPRAAVNVARAPRVVGSSPTRRASARADSEPATMLGMGKLLPVAQLPPRDRSRDSFVAPARALPTVTATSAHPLTSSPAGVPVPSRGGRSFAQPATASSRPFARRGAGGLPQGASWVVLLVISVLLLAGVVACLRNAPSASPLRVVERRAPPPLPVVPARVARAVEGRALHAPPVATPPALPASFATLRSRAEDPRASTLARPSASPAMSPTPPSSPGAAIALPVVVVPTTSRRAAVDLARGVDTVSTQQAPPIGRLAARREAVNLLLAGHTRAALAVYRELPPSLRADPALTQVIQLLERELRACDEALDAACGT